MLRRNLIEFVQHRELLSQNGVPPRRGILFYGPPGTGKTYTCKYVQHELPEITTIVVAGDDLANVKPICDLARLLQPCLLVLEDVDLAFATREINPFNSALGDLLDEMDGFQSNDAIVFLLTTNAIERLEPAIKERPGRISQCIYFGFPKASLRKAYLERFLRPYDQHELRVDALVTMTDGTSQAFLKELVARAVQIALEEPARPKDILALTMPDFDEAFREMTKHATQMTRSTLGFSGK